MTEKEQDFARRLRERMGEHGDRLSGHALSRLNQARHAALAELDRPRGFSARGWLPATGALATAVVVAVLLRQGQIPGQVPADAPAEDMEILLSGEDLELYEDLEFYAWLEMQPELG